MDEEQLKEYLKENLKIKATRQGGYYESDTLYIDIELKLEDEVISQDSFYIG